MENDTAKKQSLISKNRLILYAANLCLLFFAYGGYFRESFSADTLGEAVWPYMNVNSWPLRGRFLAFALGRLLLALNIRTFFHYQICFFIFMILIALSMTILQESMYPIVKRHLSNTAMTRLSLFCFSGLIFVNGLFHDNFMFPECFLTFSAAYLFSVTGLGMLLKKRLILAALLLLAGAMFYQTPLIVVVLIAITCVFLESDTLDKTFFLRSATILLLCIALIGCTVYAGGLFESAFVDNPNDYSAAWANAPVLAMQILYAVKNFLRSGLGLLPPLFLPLIATLFPPVVCMINGSKTQQPSRALLLLLFAICGILFSFSIAIGSRTAVFSGRILPGLYTTQATILLLALIDCKKDSLRRLLAGFTCFYLAIQVIFSNIIMMNHYISNTLDIAYAEGVYAQIQEYEEKTGHKIRYIASAADADCRDSYDHVYYKFGEINARSVHRTPFCMLTYVTMDDNRFFELGEMNSDIYRDNFSGKNWEVFLPQEQLVFRDDTLYWCVY